MSELYGPYTLNIIMIELSVCSPLYKIKVNHEIKINNNDNSGLAESSFEFFSTGTENSNFWPTQ